MSNGIKAISLWQPWASLWLTDLKVHETRHWHTKHRGLLYVHAAKRPIAEADLTPELRALCEDQFGGHFWNDLPRGAIIGIVDLIDCHSTSIMPGGEHAHDLICGNWQPGRYAWKRAPNPMHIGPWPYTGRQGLFNVNDLDQVANRVLGIT